MLIREFYPHSEEKEAVFGTLRFWIYRIYHWRQEINWRKNAEKANVIVPADILSNEEIEKNLKSSISRAQEVFLHIWQSDHYSTSDMSKFSQNLTEDTFEEAMRPHFFEPKPKSPKHSNQYTAILDELVVFAKTCP